MYIIAVAIEIMLKNSGGPHTKIAENFSFLEGILMGKYPRIWKMYKFMREILGSAMALLGNAIKLQFGRNYIPLN